MNSLIIIILLLGAIILSTIIGIVLSRLMIKKSSKNPHLIIHGTLFLGSVIWLITAIITIIIQLTQYGAFADRDIIEIGWPFLILLPLSGYLFFSLIIKKDFLKKVKYLLNFFTGGLISTILSLLLVGLIGIVFHQDGLGIAITELLIMLIGTICSVVAGIIGFFLDKYRTNF